MLSFEAPTANTSAILSLQFIQYKPPFVHREEGVSKLRFRRDQCRALREHGA